MRSRSEKGGGSFAGIKLLLCENPLPPIEEAIAAGQSEVPRSNYYTEAHSAPLRRLISAQLGVPERLIHINAGSELILRQLFDRFGEQVHLLTPTYPLFPEIAQRWSETRLLPERDFAFDLAWLSIPEGTTLAVIVNPNNPNGGTFDMAPLPGLLERYPRTRFLVDEAFIGLAGRSVAALVPEHPNLLVTRTLSKAHSLAGFRVGYAVLPEAIADDLNPTTTPIRSRGRARRRRSRRSSARTRSARDRRCCAIGPDGSRASCAAWVCAPFPAKPISSWRISRRTTPGRSRSRSPIAASWSSRSAMRTSVQVTCASPRRYRMTTRALSRRCGSC